MHPIRPQPGSSLDPVNIVGRRDVTRRARRALLDDNNICVNDPRRMGKTVWLDLFCSAPGEGLEAVKIDYEGVRTTEVFLTRTVEGLRAHRTLPGKAKAKLQALFENAELGAGPVTIKAGVSTRTAIDLLDETVRSVDAHLADDVMLVIAMDEVPLAIANITEDEGAAAAHLLLQTLRSLRRTGSSLRWIVCGSIGFHHVLRRCGATEGVINDLVNLPLGPLQPDEAHELAQRLLLGVDRRANEPTAAVLVEICGAIPFLIHALAHHLEDAGTGPVEANDVTTAFGEFMDDRDDSRAVTHLVTRLDPLYGDDAAAAEAILDRVALDEATRVDDLDADASLLDDLIDDHYLIERDRVLRWRYDVLRKIWMHRRRLG